MDIRSALIKYGFNSTRITAFELVGEYDVEEEGFLDLKDFVRMCSNLKVRDEPERDVMNIFRKYDLKKKGYFDAADVIRVSKKIGESCNQEQAEGMCKSMSPDGKVTFTVFYDKMKYEKLELKEFN